MSLFLIGAGGSKPSGYPITKDIDDVIYSGRGITFDGNYYEYDDKSSTPPDEVKLISLLLRILRKKDKTTYESIYSQIESITNYYRLEESLFSDFVGIFYQIADSVLSEYPNHNIPFGLGRSLFDNALSYIKDVVSSIISGRREKAILSIREDHYYKVFLEIVERLKSSHLDIFTLNHDTLIEDYLSESGYKYIDGFINDDPKIGVSRWENSVFADPSERYIGVYKLHGSVDWYKFDAQLDIPGQKGVESTPVLLKLSRDELTKLKNQPSNYTISKRILRSVKEYTYKCIDGTPKILLGTTTKYYDYTDVVNLELLNRFRERLSRHNNIVIVGYSWGDDVINRIIYDWCERDRSRKILLIENSRDWECIDDPNMPHKQIIPNYDGIESVDTHIISEFI